MQMKAFIVLGFLLLAGSTSAADTKFGAGIVKGNYSVEDPDGSTDSASETAVVGVMTLPVNRNFPSWRYWFQLGHNSFSLDSGGSDVGQDVTSTSLEAHIHRGFNVSSEFKPWLGLGMGASLSDFENRHSVDEDGFLDETFEDRSETNMFLVLNGGAASTKLEGGFHIGAALSHKVPLDDGIEATELNLFFLF